MNKLTKSILSLLSCMAAAAPCTLNAQAAEQSETDGNTVYIETVCPDFKPLGEDAFVFSGLYNNNVNIEIVQHSPERENLELYNTTLESDKTKLYVFRAEPGDYTVTISTASVFGGSPDCTYTQDVKIENPDYATGEDAFSATRYAFFGKYLSTADSEKAAAQKLYEEPVLRSNSETKKGVMCAVGFPRYNRQRGDFNGDGSIDSADAQLTLNTYADALAGKTDTTQPAARHACDINGDGALDSADAQNILIYYVEETTGNTPKWPDGSTAAKFDQGYADHSAVYPGESYPVQMKLVPYFSDEVPAAEADRKAQIAAAEALLKLDVVMTLNVSEPDDAFLYNNEKRKELKLQFAPQLGRFVNFNLFNSSKLYPELTELGIPVGVKTEGLGAQTTDSSLRLKTFRFDKDTDPAYFTGAYAEYNVNTGKWKVWNSTKTEALPAFNVSYN